MKSALLWLALVLSLLFANVAAYLFTLLGVALDAWAGYWLWMLWFLPSLAVLGVVAMLPAYLLVGERGAEVVAVPAVVLAIAAHLVLSWSSSVVIVPNPICDSTIQSAIRDSERCAYLCLQEEIEVLSGVSFVYTSKATSKQSSKTYTYRALGAKGGKGPYSIWLKQAESGGRCVLVDRNGVGLPSLREDLRSTRDAIIGELVRDPNARLASYRSWVYAIVVLLNLAALAGGISLVAQELKNKLRLT
jgi:hypothetical protein